MYFSVAASSANPEEAVKVLNYLINDIDCNNILLAERGIPAPSAVADAIAPNLPEASQMEIEFIKRELYIIMTWIERQMLQE